MPAWSGLFERPSVVQVAPKLCPRGAKLRQRGPKDLQLERPNGLQVALGGQLEGPTGAQVALGDQFERPKGAQLTLGGQAF